MLEAVTSALTVVLSWIGTVLSSLITTDGELSALLPLFAVFCAVSAVMLSIKVIRGFIWGA